MIPPPSSVFFAFLFFKIKKSNLATTTEPEKCYNVTEVLQLQPLSSKGCNVCNVVTAEFQFFFYFFTTRRKHYIRTSPSVINSRKSDQPKPVFRQTAKLSPLG